MAQALTSLEQKGNGDHLHTVRGWVGTIVCAELLEDPKVDASQVVQVWVVVPHSVGDMCQVMYLSLHSSLLDAYAVLW